MQATISDAGTLRKQLTITYTSAEVQARRDEVLKRLAGRVQLDGFRPGKSSKGMVERRFGPTATAQAQEDLADEGFRKALTEHHLRPVGPVVNDALKRDDGLTVTCSFDIRPALTLPEPKTLGITDEPIKVEDAEIDKVMQSVCRQAGQLAPLGDGQTIIADDSVTLAGTVTVAGAEVRKLHDFHHLVGGYPLLGKPTDEVIAAFANKKVGDVVELTAVLPASFVPKEAAGKEAVINVTVQSVMRQQAVPADDDLAKKMGYPDIAGMKDGIRARFTERQENEKHLKQLDQLTAALLDKVQVEVPPKLLADAVAANLEAKVKQAETEGKSADEIATIKAETPAMVEKSLRRFLILDTIADLHQVQVSNEDLAGQIHMAASRTGRKADEIAKQLQESGQINQVVAEIREAKALETYLDLALGRNPNPAHGEAGHVHTAACNH